MSKQTLFIGIDPGTRTGFASWDSQAQCFLAMDTLSIHKAMQRVEYAWHACHLRMVVFEDARLRKWFGHADLRVARSGAGVREGVGSVKRDCAIWADFLGDLKVPHLAVKPQAGQTKLTAEQFERLTKWTGRTSDHARDAAMLVFGRT